MTLKDVSSRTPITIVALLMSLMAAAQPQEGADRTLAELDWYSEEYPPYNYSGEDGVPKGIAVEVLLQAFEKLDIGLGAQDIQIVPWNRSYKYIRSKPGTALFSMTYTPERQQIMKFVGPVIPTTVSVIALKRRKLGVAVPTNLDGLRIGTVRDDIGDQLARSLELGGVILVRKNSLKQLIFLLATDRVDAVAYEADVFRHALSQSGDDPALYEEIVTLKEGQLGYAFHNATDPEILVPLQNAIDEIRADGTLETIIAKYLH